MYRYPHSMFYIFIITAIITRSRVICKSTETIRLSITDVILFYFFNVSYKLLHNNCIHIQSKTNTLNATNDIQKG